MAEPLIVISRYRVKEGKLDQVISYDTELLEFVQANEPQIVAFHVFLNEDGTEMTSIQVHPDTASMALHMQVMRDNWEAMFSEYGDLMEIIGVEYYGTPAKSALEMDVQSGIRVSLNPRHISGFTRHQAGT